ncbi:1699_t:CDS:2, partial [Cetraspora pellucida]
QGRGAYLLEEKPDSEVFECSVGNIEPGQKVVIKIKYVTELQHCAETDSISFNLPAAIAPKYGTHIFNHRKMRCDEDSELKYHELKLSITCTMSSRICSIKSPSHKIKFTELNDKPEVTLDETIHYLEKDFILLIKSQNIYKPRAFIEYNPRTGTNCLMLTLVPTFKNSSVDYNSIKTELIFIIDSSGSMKGRSIEKVSKALQFLLLSIPESCFFNVISTGHEKDSERYLFKEKSQPCTKENIVKAIEKVQKITARGGTYIYEALDWVFEKHSHRNESSFPDMPTSVILFSDFETSKVDKITDLIKKNQENNNNLRIFSIGMNNSISHHFIESIVRIGKGYAQYVSKLEQMNRKAMIMLRNSLNPPITDYEITWVDEILTHVRLIIGTSKSFVGTQLIKNDLLTEWSMKYEEYEIRR